MRTKGRGGFVSRIRTTSLREFSDNKSERKARTMDPERAIKGGPIRSSMILLFPVHGPSRQDPFRARRSIYLVDVVDVVEPKTRRDRRGRLWYVTSLAAGHESYLPSTSNPPPLPPPSLAVPMVLAMMNLSRKATPLSRIARRDEGEEGEGGGWVIRALFLISWDKAAAF